MLLRATPISRLPQKLGVADTPAFKSLTLTEGASVRQASVNAQNLKLSKYNDSMFWSMAVQSANGLNIGYNGNLDFVLHATKVLGIGATSIGSGFNSGLALKSGTPPTTQPADVVQVYAKDRATGKAGLVIMAEDGTRHMFSDNLGAGTVDPWGKLTMEVTSSAAFSSSYLSGTDATMPQSTDAFLYNNDASANVVGVKFRNRAAFASTAKIELVHRGDRRGDLVFFTRDTDLNERVRITYDGALVVAGNTLRLSASRTPASATAAGVQGDMAWDSGYVYVCVATNQWKRAALSVW